MLGQLMDLFSGRGNTQAILMNLCALAFVTLFCLPVHESAHAWMAAKLGDDTGRLSGRISLNPMDHLSPMGTLMLFIFGFGYAKPVPVNIRNFEPKKRKAFFGLTAFAGPLSNLIMALIFGLLANLSTLLGLKGVMSGSSLFIISFNIFYLISYYNVALAVFNLIPIPPLDGSRLITAILPDKIYYKIMQYERYSMFILFGIIILFNIIHISPLSFLTEKLMKVIFLITRLPFSFLL